MKQPWKFWQKCLLAVVLADLPLLPLAGGISNLAFFAPDQRVDLQVTEDKAATLRSADIDLPLRCTDEALFGDLLAYLRAHPYIPGQTAV